MTTVRAHHARKVNKMRDDEKKKLVQCPACEELSFEYDPDIDAFRCQNEFCRWTDKISPANDVPMSFLRYCLSRVEPGPKKEKIKRIIELTEKANLTAR